MILTKRMSGNMDIDYIKKMFVGEILIIDDEVDEEYTEAWTIRLLQRIHFQMKVN